MITQSSRSLLDISAQCKTIPIIENRLHFTQVLDISQIKATLLRHCNLFELTSLLHNAHRRALSVYVNIDHIDGIHADFAGLGTHAASCQSGIGKQMHERFLGEYGGPLAHTPVVTV